MKSNFLVKNTYVFVLFSLLVVIFMLPLLGTSNLIFTTIYALPLITGIYASLEDKSKMRYGIGLGLTALTLNFLISWETTNDYMTIVRFLFFLLFLSYVVFMILKRVIKSQEIDFNIIAGAISVYIIFILIFSLIFSLIYHFDQESFNGLNVQELTSRDFNYFSLVTITTLGYGDITPAAPIARSFSMLLVLLGQMYLTILVAILVSKFKGWKILQDKEGN